MIALAALQVPIDTAALPMISPPNVAAGTPDTAARQCPRAAVAISRGKPTAVALRRLPARRSERRDDRKRSTWTW